MECRSWVRHPCFAVQAKTGENQPDFPPESLLKDKKEAECQDQCVLANDQQGVYSSYTLLADVGSGRFKIIGEVGKVQCCGLKRFACSRC